MEALQHKLLKIRYSLVTRHKSEVSGILDPFILDNFAVYEMAIKSLVVHLLPIC